ncbi:glycosyl transferase family protein [Roseitranquillus sediminis]|uniref:glycosyl transferase family protein n=1 Tax=Roseitranquillus sediminis TaxID=2809051 RepID=UPI001D0CAED5|nr:glycosyl transferase family protein [Roseitranquillus sediminis]MBM9595819.1 glycosyl transferase family protein [Roseitranquillus sediminis]
MSLAPFVRIVGRGPGRSRSLTRDEAREAMRLILAGEVAPEAVGALLMLMRFRGESAGEVAGFVEALRETLPAWPGIAPALDWPSYAAGRTRGVPWFLLSARLVASAGVPVLIHGWNSHQSLRASVRGGLDVLGLPVASTPEAAARDLERSGVAYLPLEVMSPGALELLRLRDVLGLRSAMNTVLRVLDPAGAPASVQGVFHPPYRALQADAGALLGQSNLTVLKGGGGEFERHPGKAVELFGLRDGGAWSDTAPAVTNATRRLGEDDHAPGALADLWEGRLEDTFAEAVVLGTAALALETAGRAGVGGGMALARELWSNRHRARAA